MTPDFWTKLGQACKELYEKREGDRTTVTGDGMTAILVWNSDGTISVEITEVT